MGKVKAPQTLSNLKELSELSRYVSITLESLISEFNGFIDFSANMRTSLATVTFPGALSTLKVPHTIQKIPTGYIVVRKNADVTVFDGAGTNTDKEIYLQASGSSTVTVLIF